MKFTRRNKKNQQSGFPLGFYDVFIHVSFLNHVQHHFNEVSSNRIQCSCTTRSLGSLAVCEMAWAEALKLWSWSVGAVWGGERGGSEREILDQHSIVGNEGNYENAPTCPWKKFTWRKSSQSFILLKTMDALNITFPVPVFRSQNTTRENQEAEQTCTGGEKRRSSAGKPPCSCGRFEICSSIRDERLEIPFSLCLNNGVDEVCEVIWTNPYLRTPGVKRKSGVTPVHCRFTRAFRKLRFYLRVSIVHKNLFWSWTTGRVLISFCLNRCLGLLSHVRISVHVNLHDS